jgi:HAD superfamily hydrolase (TIGR01509 family)
VIFQAGPSQGRYLYATFTISQERFPAAIQAVCTLVAKFGIIRACRFEGVGRQGMSHRLQAVLLDVDGTLADTEEVHRQAFNAAFAAAGLDWVWEPALYHELLAVTGGRERIRHYLQRERPEFPLPDNAAEFIAALHRAKTGFYVEALSSGKVPLRPGVERLLADARANGLRLAIVTTTTPDNITALLEHSFSRDVSGWFELIAAGNVVPHKKPAPDIYHYTLQRMHLQPEDCIAIEDSLNGLRAAAAAGVPTLITVNPYTAGQDFSGAALVLDHLGEADAPCTVLAGERRPDGMVDADFLVRLHAEAISVT